MTGLDDAGRGSLERLISRARRILEDDLSSVAERRLGIHRDGTIEDEEALRLTISDLAGRREVAAIVTHLRNEGETPGGAVERLIREASFTHLNRLVAIRVAESIGILPPSLAEGKSSRGFREVLELAPLLGSDPYGGYWSYLRLCGDELAADAPILFDPRNPLLTLAPSPSAVDELLSLFSERALIGVWQAPDTLGWMYQFFNTPDERRQMRERGAPKNSRELAVRNQFFTPQYVVDFLVQNSLGRRLVEAGPDVGLVEDLPLLVDPPTKSGQPLRLEEFLILDPACGSGHFLLGAYDVLEKAWARAGIKPSEAAPRILLCLHGVDIDPRCAQLASAALMLRARRVCPKADLPRPNMVTARALPRDTDAWQRVISVLRPDRQRLVRVLHETLGQAPALGSLLKVEDRLTGEIKRLAPEPESGRGTLGELWHRADTLLDAETDVLSALQRLADEASSSAAERLLAAEAGDAIRFVEAMRRRYDVVLMNPPFGEAIPATKEYLKAAYPSSKDNLFATFVARGLELCRPGGYVGAITSRAGMFLSSFERWRKEVLFGHRLVALADLGYGVMEQAMVEAAAYVVGEEKATTREATFIRLLKEADRPEALRKAIEASRTGSDRRVFRLTPSEMQAVPGAPVAYWMAAWIRTLFATLPPLEGNGASVHQGLATGDDFRFIRCSWEVEPARIARSRQETLEGRRWVPFAKGGEYSPYWADLHLVVDWQEDGKSIRQALLPGTRVQNTQYYFKAGITWPLRTASGFGPRVLTAGNLFGHKGPVAFPVNGVAIELTLAWLASRIATACLIVQVAAGEETTSGAAAKSYEVGLVQKIPWPAGLSAHPYAAHIGDLARDLIQLRMKRDQQDETAGRFVAPASVEAARILEAATTRIEKRERDVIAAIGQSRRLEALLHELLSLDPTAERYLDAEVGPHPDTLPNRPLDAGSHLKRWYELPLDKVIDEVVAEQGGSRAVVNLAYVADRRLEVLAHALGRHPVVVAQERRKLGLLPPDEPRASADDLLSYLVGVAFGRWDVRIARNPEMGPPAPAIFAPAPACPPGMLTDRHGLPVRKTPASYPLELPPEQVLLDEMGSGWDIEGAIRRGAQAIFEDADPVLQELEAILGRSFRDHLRRQFFKDHLSRYTKSRRQAPIYWQLSTPLRAWGVWVYAPVLSRETLFAIARHAGRRLATGREVVAGLQADRAAGGRGRSPRELATRIAEEEDLGSELEAFRVEAERVAAIGWEPDLDDGLVLCAAPLSRLFPVWPAAAEELANLKAGKYEWATVARWRDLL